MASLYTGTPIHVPLTYIDGDSPPRLAFRLFSRNVRSYEVSVRPAGSDVVEWTTLFSDGSVTKTSAAGGGLVVDPQTRITRYPLRLADLAKIPLGGSVAFVIRVVNGDGFRRTYATGTITRKRLVP